MISDVALFLLMEKKLETFEGFMGKNDIFVVGMINRYRFFLKILI
jgi:hypothetical protein